MARPSQFSPAVRERVFQLAEEGKNAPTIAKLIGKHPSTVQWFMYTEGLKAPAQRAAARSYTRNGRVVHLFTEAEDRFITARRVAGDSFRSIADGAAARFGTARKPHSIQVRLIMLASVES